MNEFDEITSRVEKVATARLGRPRTLEPLKGDASARCYFRIRGNEGFSRIAACYPLSLTKQVSIFQKTYDSLKSHIPLPEVIHVENGVVIQQDVGDISLARLMEESPLEAVSFFERSVELIGVVQRLGADASPNPPFSRHKFESELEMTVEFWVTKMSGVSDPGQLREIRVILRSIAKNITHHRYVLCHRDFHSENILIQNNSIFIIDYQDARMGPDYYDLASLLRDRGMVEKLGRDTESRLIDRFRESTASGPLEHYWEVLLQRALKTIGTFASQATRRGRRDYIAYIPPTLESVRDCVANLPQYRDLLSVFPMTLRT